MGIRPYDDQDYDAIKALYMQGDLYGGQFDEARDAREKLAYAVHRDPESILVYEENDDVIGTVSLIDDGRVAWLFRFAVKRSADESTVVSTLHQEACRILAKRGHTQVLVYAPVANAHLAQRYADIGMHKGGDYTCFWQELN